MPQGVSTSKVTHAHQNIGPDPLRLTHRRHSSSGGDGGEPGNALLEFVPCPARERVASWWKPGAREEVHLLLIEPTGTNTGEFVTSAPRRIIWTATLAKSLVW